MGKAAELGSERVSPELYSVQGTLVRSALLFFYFGLHPQRHQKDLWNAAFTMFGRAISRSLRSHLHPALIQPSLPQSFSRTYAKNKHKRPHEQRIHRTPPNGFQTNTNISDTESAREPVARETVESPSASNSTIGRSSEASNSPSAQQRAEQDAGVDSSNPSYRPPSQFAPEISEPEAEPLRPLPDLTKGIPSTLDYEIAQASTHPQSDSTSLNVREDPSNASAGGRQGSDFPNSAYISSLERRRNRIANFMYASILGISVFGTIYLGRNWDTEDEEIKHVDAPSGWGLGLFYNRARARLRDMLDYYNEPTFPKLLPNVDPIFERPYTLVLSLEDLLVHSEWTREHGWRSAKRPGVDYFIRYLSQYYELVIFTTAASMNADPIIRKLDPFHVIPWPLFREATRFKDGTYIKVRLC